MHVQAQTQAPVCSGEVCDVIWLQFIIAWFGYGLGDNNRTNDLAKSGLEQQ